MQKWMKKLKMHIEMHWMMWIVIFFISLPFLLNAGLYITDIIYAKYSFALTADGLKNKDWLDFWQTYLSVVIAFMGICFAWKSSDKERKMHDNEMLAKDYEEHLTEEKNVLIEVCQSFNTDIIYQTLIELGEVNTKESKIILQNAREKVLDVQIKFELLTDIADNFQKCENCKFKPCYDRENMIALRDLYYKLKLRT